MRQPSCDCGICPKCKRRLYMREWWNQLTPEERRAKRKRRDPEKVREQHRLKMAKRRQRADPDFVQKQQARMKVKGALKSGRLQRGSCQVGIDCKGRIEAHHDDYTKPLDVIWLCARHHRERDCSGSSDK